MTDEVVARWTMKIHQTVNLPLEKIVNHYVPVGLERRQKYIPIILDTVLDDHRLAVLRSGDGKLTRCESVEPYTAATSVVSSGDGRQVAWTWTVQDEESEGQAGEQLEKSFAIHESETGQKLVEKSYTRATFLPPGEPRPMFLRTIGFDKDRQLIMVDPTRVFGLPVPYDGKLQLKFHLQQSRTVDERVG